MSGRPSSLSRKLAAAIDKVVETLTDAVRPVIGPQERWQPVRIRTQTRQGRR